MPANRNRQNLRVNSRSGETSPRTALLVIGGAMALSALVSSRYRPDPTHPNIQRWYKRLNKPSYKPPDPLFGAIWPVLESLISVGAYRLMRSPRSPERNQAIALWAANVALVTGYAKIFFGERSLSGGVAAGALLALTSAAFVERAARVDGVAAATGVPIALWSVFGSVMGENIRERNPGLDGRDPPRARARTR